MNTVPIEIRISQAFIVASALELYAKTKMKVNRAYTPKAMIDTASRITGQVFMQRDYQGAADALRLWARNQRVSRFVDAVAVKVLEYGEECTDGVNLARTLLDAGVITIADGVDHAARIVAQHLLQQ